MDRRRRRILRHCVAALLVLPGLEMAQAQRRTRRVAFLGTTDPADMPVEQVNVCERVVDLKTVRRLGIEMPKTFLLQATQTIE